MDKQIFAVLSEMPDYLQILVEKCQLLIYKPEVYFYKTRCFNYCCSITVMYKMHNLF